MRNPTEGRPMVKFRRHYRSSSAGGVRRKFIHWRGLVGTVEVRLALLKVDGWRGIEDTKDSQSL